jgi:hypothetical protein
LINMTFTMACPNFKKGLKMAFGPLGVNHVRVTRVLCASALTGQRGPVRMHFVLSAWTGKNLSTG